MIRAQAFWVTVLLLTLAVPGASLAQHGGQIGLGLYYTDTPIGAFYGINDKIQVHAGFGFTSNDLTPPDDPLAVDNRTKNEIRFTAAVSYDFVQGKGWGFGAIPDFRYTYTEPVKGDLDRTYTFGLHLGGHWDPIPSLSLWFKHGLDIVYSDVGGGDSTLDFATPGFDLGSFGVTFYLNARE